MLAERSFSSVAVRQSLWMFKGCSGHDRSSTEKYCRMNKFLADTKILIKQMCSPGRPFFHTTTFFVLLFFLVKYMCHCFHTNRIQNWHTTSICTARADDSLIPLLTFWKYYVLYVLSFTPYVALPRWYSLISPLYNSKNCIKINVTESSWEPSVISDVWDCINI